MKVVEENNKKIYKFENMANGRSPEIDEMMKELPEDFIKKIEDKIKHPLVLALNKSFEEEF